jgi:hypothetical protein
MATRYLFPALVVTLALAAGSEAQQTNTLFTLQAGAVAASPVGVIESIPLESVTSVPNAPFSAEAETEFTQVLGDGNRIERRYSSMMARDSQGRTRREEEIALVGPLAVDGPSPRLVTIVDPVAGHSYTLDERQRIAFRNPAALNVQGAHFFFAGGKESTTWVAAAEGNASWAASGRPTIRWTDGKANVAIAGVPGQRVLVRDPAASKFTSESLGTRSIEGVMAEGTRTTSTIAPGAIGNLMPIEVVTERWYSRELQMAVLISRKDPRSGDSVYRLRNIVRTEPPADLFTVPPDYEVRGGQLGGFNIKKLEVNKLEGRPKK